MSRESNTLALISAVTSVKTEAELLEKSQPIARAMGFDQFLFGIEMRLAGTDPVQHITSGFNRDYQLLYQQRAFIGVDPTVPHCQTRTDPLIWKDAMYGDTSREMMEEARRFGLRYGVSLPVHESEKVVSMLSLGRDQPFESEAERDFVLAAGNVLAHCLHVAAENVIVPEVIASRRPHLSPREKQCFQLVAHGKSNWDIGQILNISEAAAAFHVKNVLKKLKVSSRMQAVAIGVSLGMIT